MEVNQNRPSLEKGGLVIALAITSIMMFAEVIGGIISNSLALLSDAGHMLTDIFALALSLFAIKYGEKPATLKKTYGFYRLEILSSLINGTILILISLYIFYKAYQRVLQPPEINAPVMMGIAFLGLVVNIIAAISLRKSSKENLNVRGAYLHIIGDAFSSIGVLTGGFIILFTGWYIIDSILSVLIGIVIIVGAYSLMKESVDILLEATPKGIDLEEVIGEIRKIKGVKDIHHVHLWTITSGIYALSGHVLIEDILTSKSTEVLGNINSILRDRFYIDHTTLQFECETCEDSLVCRLERNHLYES
ncbi:MAG: cation transporter [Nitrospirae bacterium]|nr:cation transporter [Nitrospirota bacterium]